MSDTIEGFIDLRITLFRGDDGLIGPSNIYRTESELPTGTTEAAIHRMIHFFLSETETLADYIAYAIQGVEEDNV